MFLLMFDQTKEEEFPLRHMLLEEGELPSLVGSDSASEKTKTALSASHCESEEIQTYRSVPQQHQHHQSEQQPQPLNRRPKRCLEDSYKLQPKQKFICRAEPQCHYLKQEEDLLISNQQLMEMYFERVLRGLEYELETMHDERWHCYISLGINGTVRFEGTGKSKRQAEDFACLGVLKWLAEL